MSAEDQPAIFCFLVVVEKHSCLGPVYFRKFLAFYNYSGQPLVVGDNHSQSPVSFNNIDSVDFDTIEALDALRRCARQHQDHEYRAQKSGVSDQNSLDRLLHILSNTKGHEFV